MTVNTDPVVSEAAGIASVVGIEALATQAREPSILPSLADDQEEDHRLRQSRNGGRGNGFPRGTRRPLRIALVAILLTLLVFGALFLAFLGPLKSLIPGVATNVTVTITPTSKVLTNAYVISAVTLTPNPAQNQVAARMIASVTPAQSKTVRTTGLGHVPGVQAKGRLTFYNALDHSQTIAVGTVLTDANGVQLVNDEAAVIPAATPPAEGSVTAAAHAVNAGVNGNISAFDFNTVPCCTSGVSVQNTSAFSGGQDAYSYAFVEQGDIDGVVNPFQASPGSTIGSSESTQAGCCP